MGLVPVDYDVATSAAPDQVRALFPRTKAVGEHFGVVIVWLDHVNTEVATFRTDSSYSDRRRPDRVEFSDAPSDALRRDFTINGLFRDPLTNDVIDYVGGLADIRARLIRAIGDPEARLAEDHLRALRAVRFAARFDFTLDPATRAAVALHASELRGVSRERLGAELRRMFAHPSRAQACRLIESLGLDAPMLDEPPRGPDQPLSILAHLPADSSPPFAASLAAWALDRHDDRRRIPSRWRKALILSNDESDLLRDILDQVDLLRTRWTALRIAHRKRLAALPAFPHTRTVLAALDAPALALIDRDLADHARIGGGLAPAPFITGDDLNALGLPPGPLYKTILDELYDAQLEGALPDRAAAESLARQRIAQSHA